MDLAFEGGRVDDGADIVDNNVVEDFDRAGVTVDLQFAVIATIGEGVTGRLESPGLVEAAFDLAWQPAGLERRAGDVLEAHRTVGTGDGELAIAEIEIRWCDFEQVGSDFFALGD